MHKLATLGTPAVILVVVAWALFILALPRIIAILVMGAFMLRTAIGGGSGGIAVSAGGMTLAGFVWLAVLPALLFVGAWWLARHGAAGVMR